MTKEANKLTYRNPKSFVNQTSEVSKTSEVFATTNHLGCLYHCSSQVSWAVEINGIILINQKTGRSHFLGYPEATVWALMSRGYAFSKIVRMLSLIAAIDSAKARELLLTTVTELAQADFLTQDKEHG